MHGQPHVRFNEKTVHTYHQGWILAFKYGCVPTNTTQSRPLLRGSWTGGGHTDRVRVRLSPRDCRLKSSQVKNSYLPTYILTYLLTHSLTHPLYPWCRVLPEQLTGLQLVKKFPAFHGTRRFITALTSVCHLSLSWASPIQSTYPHPTSWRSIIILSTHLRLGLPSGLFPSGFPTNTLYTTSTLTYAPHAQPISFFSILSPAQHWVSSTNHLGLRCAVSSIPPLTRRTLRQLKLLTYFYRTRSRGEENCVVRDGNSQIVIIMEFLFSKQLQNDIQ